MGGPQGDSDRERFYSVQIKTERRESVEEEMGAPNRDGDRG